MMCLIWLLGTPALEGIGLLASGVEYSMKPLLRKTRSVYADNCCGVLGTWMMFTVPSVLDLGEPKLSGGTLLFGPAPRPLALETYNVLPSLLTRIAAGHQPTGM